MKRTSICSIPHVRPNHRFTSSIRTQQGVPRRLSSGGSGRVWNGVGVGSFKPALPLGRKETTWKSASDQDLPRRCGDGRKEKSLLCGPLKGGSWRSTTKTLHGIREEKERKKKRKEKKHCSSKRVGAKAKVWVGVGVRAGVGVGVTMRGLDLGSGLDLGLGFGGNTGGLEAGLGVRWYLGGR